MSYPVTQIQTALASLGYEAGKADGLFGPRTEAAAEAWIAAKGRAKPAAGAAAVAGLPMIYQGKAQYPVREIVVHCSATPPEWMTGLPFAAKVREIRLWHTRDRGWKDIGYTWLCDRDGSILPGRPETVIGAGVEGHNSGVIHICLIGGHGAAATDPFQRHFTTLQNTALRDLIRKISAHTQIAEITGHNQWAAKACPGFSVPLWLKGS